MIPGREFKTRRVTATTTMPLIGTGNRREQMSTANVNEQAREAMKQRADEMKLEMKAAWEEMKAAEKAMQPTKDVYETALGKWAQLHSRYGAMIELLSFSDKEGAK